MQAIVNREGKIPHFRFIYLYRTWWNFKLIRSKDIKCFLQTVGNFNYYFFFWIIDLFLLHCFFSSFCGEYTLSKVDIRFINIYFLIFPELNKYKLR